MHKLISMTKIEFHNVDVGVSSVLYTPQLLTVERDEINRFSANSTITEHSVTTLRFDTRALFIKLVQTHTTLTSIS